MMRKVVALNSGGFDSTTMLYWLKDHLESSYTEPVEVHSLFFDYGQRNRDKEFNCAKHNHLSLGFHSSNFVKIMLSFPWTHSSITTYDLHGNSHEVDVNQYLEFRNLVFLSYAMSYAESICAEDIYLAIIDTAEPFIDTTRGFYESFNEFNIANATGIQIQTPFIRMTKEDLIPYAVYYDITPSMYFSCNTPVDGEPCGECQDCLVLSEMQRTIERHKNK